jgi:hypothetical protein
MFEGDKADSKYNPKLFKEASKAFVKTLSEEIFISEKTPPR